MLGDLLQRKSYNAVMDFVDAPVARGLAEVCAQILEPHFRRAHTVFLR